jgi:hypothetical protein
MENSPAPQNQQNSDSDVTQLVKLLLQAVDDGKGLNAITQVVSEQVQAQTEQTLIEFSESVRQTNLAAVEVMAEELARIKDDSQTVRGVLERLKAVAAPDLVNSLQGEVVSYRQAINNLERYGSIIPTDGDIAKSQLIARKNQAWSLFWQSVIKLVINKIQIKLEDKKS